MSMEFKVDGFKDLAAMLERLQSVRREEGALTRAMIKAVEPTADLTRALVPVRTGNLRRSITVSDKLKGRTKEAGITTVYLGTSYGRGQGGRHGHLVEFGTKHSRPRPFLRPAWDQDSRAMLLRLAEELRLQIEKAVRRKGR
jgi:HK97 gp10 family phage protein